MSPLIYQLSLPSKIAKDSSSNDSRDDVTIFLIVDHIVIGVNVLSSPKLQVDDTIIVLLTLPMACYFEECEY